MGYTGQPTNLPRRASFLQPQELFSNPRGCQIKHGLPGLSPALCRSLYPSRFCPLICFCIFSQATVQQTTQLMSLQRTNTVLFLEQLLSQVCLQSHNPLLHPSCPNNHRSSGPRWCLDRLKGIWEKMEKKCSNGSVKMQPSVYHLL